MSVENETPAAETPESAPAPQSSEPAAEAPKEPAKANVWDSPETAQAEIERLRRENAKDRTNAKAQAAEEARSELAQTIGKALGLVKDEPIDPATLAESVSASQAEAKQARVELAVFRNAADGGGDPSALLDSTSFLRSLESVDPSDAAAVAAAIKAAVDANPRLAAAPSAPRVPAPNPAQGASASGTPSTADLAAQAAANGDFTQSAALKAQQLLALQNQSH